MLKFSSAQMLAFEDANWRNFVNVLARDLGEKVPQLLARLGEVRLAHAVHQNANLAYSRFGLREDADIAAYIDHAARLGTGFYEDLVIYWAGDILTDGGFVLTEERMSYLESNVLDHCASAYGDAGAFAPLEAFARFRQMQTSGPISDLAQTGRPITLLEAVWPERAALCELIQLRDFCEEAAALAHAYDISDPGLQARFALLAFLFGARFDADRFHPWAADILLASGQAGQEVLARLEQAAVAEVIDPWMKSAAAPLDDG